MEDSNRNNLWMGEMYYKVGDGIDAGSLIHCPGRGKMQVSMAEPRALRRKSLCYSVTCPNGTRAGRRKGSFEKWAGTSQWADSVAVKQRAVKRHHCRYRLDCENSPLRGASKPETSFNLLMRWHHEPRHRVDQFR